MIEISINPSAQIGHIVLKPNQSANWQTVVLIISLISFIILIIALYMASIGAWLILPFSGLEIFALIMANYYFLRRNALQEVINFSVDSVTIERGVNIPSQTIRFQRHWTKFKIIPAPHPWYPKKIALYCENQHVAVGSFLNEDDLELLADLLKDILKKPH